MTPPMVISITRETGVTLLTPGTQKGVMEITDGNGVPTDSEAHGKKAAMANPQLSKRLQLHVLWVTSGETEGVRLDLAERACAMRRCPKLFWRGRG